MVFLDYILIVNLLIFFIVILKVNILVLVFLILYSNVGWVVLRELLEFSREFFVEGGDINKFFLVLVYFSIVFIYVKICN